MRGRKPEPEGVKAAKGNTRRQAARSLPKGPEKAGALPKFVAPRKARKLHPLGKRVRAKEAAIVAFMRPRLEGINFLKETDLNGFVRFCRYMAEWLVYHEVLDEEGPWYLAKSEHNPDGIHRQHPASIKLHRVEQNLRMIEAEFGLTPARRQQLMLQMAAANIGVPQSAAKAPEPDPHGMFASGPIGMGARLGSTLPH